MLLGSQVLTAAACPKASIPSKAIITATRVFTVSFYNGRNSAVSLVDESQMKCLWRDARLARRFQLEWAKAAISTRRNAANGKISSQRHEIVFDFSLWGFCR